MTMTITLYVCLEFPVYIICNEVKWNNTWLASKKCLPTDLYFIINNFIQLIMFYILLLHNIYPSNDDKPFIMTTTKRANILWRDWKGGDYNQLFIASYYIS